MMLSRPVSSSADTRVVKLSERARSTRFLASLPWRFFSMSTTDASLGDFNKYGFFLLSSAIVSSNCDDDNEIMATASIETATKSRASSFISIFFDYKMTIKLNKGRFNALDRGTTGKLDKSFYALCTWVFWRQPRCQMNVFIFNVKQLISR